MVKAYRLFRDMLIAIFGGFVGAVISEYAQGRIIGVGAFFVIMFYTLITLICILSLWIANEWKKK